VWLEWLELLLMLLVLSLMLLSVLSSNKRLLSDCMRMIPCCSSKGVSLTEETLDHEAGGSDVVVPEVGTGKVALIYIKLGEKSKKSKKKKKKKEKNMNSSLK
jgi:hypothetical protein